MQATPPGVGGGVPGREMARIEMSQVEGGGPTNVEKLSYASRSIN